jgi:diguanylate cyclase (GGDEF)-like protein
MRSTISRKLLLPFALFLAPIAFLLFFLLQTHQRAISTARNEMAGIPTVVAALTTARTLIESVGTEPEARGQFRQSIDMLRTALKPWAGDAQIEVKTGELLGRLELALEQRRVSVIDVREGLDELSRMIRLIGDVSELILDPDLDTYYYMDMLVVLSPDMLTAHLEMLRDLEMSRAYRENGRPAYQQAFHHTEALQTLIQRQETAIDKTVRHARDGMPYDTAVQAGRSYVGQLKGLQFAWSSDQTAEELSSGVQKSMRAMADWQQIASQELYRLLMMRADDLQYARNQQIVLSLVMFAIAVGVLMWMTRQHVTLPLQGLTTSMISLANGAVETPLPVAARQGEVGDMVRAVQVFKENAIRNKILEAEKEEAASVLSLTTSTLEHAEFIADLGHWRFDKGTDRINWSLNLFSITGFDKMDTLPSLSIILGRVDRKDRPDLVRYMRSLFRGHQTAEFACAFHHPQFGRRYLKSQVALERKSDGEISAIIGIVQDVTQARESELNLKARTESLAEAQAIGRIGDWSYRLGASHIQWSPEIFGLLAYDPATFKTTREAVMALYEDESQERVLEAQAEVMRTGEMRAVDVQARLGDGRIADFTVTSKADLNDHGQITGFSGTIQDITERKSAERELEKLAYFDPLTGLANRALFHRTLRRELDRSLQSGSTAALLLLDLDRFKEVNDSLGHAAGDELLVLTAESLRRQLPASAFLARLGGDEFAVLLRDSDVEAAASTADRLVRFMTEPVQLRLGEVQIGTSIGIAMIPRDGSRQDTLVRNADLALYNAKDDGRSCARFFTPTLSEAVQEKSAIARDLRRALAVDDQLYVVFQPQVDLRRGAVAGFEALLRWRHPERGLIPPGVFIPVAESSSLIADLGLYVLRASCQQMKRWIDEGYPARDVAVNVSPAQIWQSDFESDVKQILMESGLPPACLTLEVTEGVFIREAEGRVRQALDGLKALGVKLALDDFGTGYSSLGYLNRLPFDKLKIDRRFIAGVHRNPERKNLLKGIIELGLGLGMTTVAEGAELMEEVRVLRQLNCDVVQGYVFSHPLEGPSAVRAAAILDLMVPANESVRQENARKAA